METGRVERCQSNSELMATAMAAVASADHSQLLLVARMLVVVVVLVVILLLYFERITEHDSDQKQPRKGPQNSVGPFGRKIGMKKALLCDLSQREGV